VFTRSVSEIYRVFQDRAHYARSEFLKLIIIALIAVGTTTFHAFSAGVSAPVCGNGRKVARSMGTSFARSNDDSQ